MCTSARCRTSSSASAKRNLPSCSSGACEGVAWVVKVAGAPGPLSVVAVDRAVPRPRPNVCGWYGAGKLRSHDDGKSTGSGSGPVAGCGCGEATRDSENGDMKPAPDRPVRLGCAGGRRSVVAVVVDGSSSSSSLSLRSSCPLIDRAHPNGSSHDPSSQGPNSLRQAMDVAARVPMCSWRRQGRRHLQQGELVPHQRLPTGNVLR